MRHDLVILFGGAVLGVPLTLFVLWAQTRFMVWRYHRKSRRELEKARAAKRAIEPVHFNCRCALDGADSMDNVDARRVAGIAQVPAPVVQEPFRVELNKDDELWPLVRYLVITLRGQDRRRFFPGELSRGMDS